MSSTSEISIKQSILTQDEIESEVCPKQIKSRGPSPTNAAALQKSKSDEETRQVSQIKKEKAFSSKDIRFLPSIVVVRVNSHMTSAMGVVVKPCTL